MTCPNCGQTTVRRSRRRGILERVISLVHVYPYRCQLCLHRFRARRPEARSPRQAVDRREYDRIKTRFPVVFAGVATRGEGIAVDLSVSGCAVQTKVSVAQGATLRLELRVSPAISVSVDALVVRSGDTGTVALRFLRLRGDEQARLLEFVRRFLVSPPG